MKQISFFIPLLGTLLLSGCAGTSTEFECNATTSDNPLTPAGLLAPTYRNQLAFIDIFFRGMNNTNYNMAVCGTSGAGKTGLIQPLIRSVLDSGGFAVVFDMGDVRTSSCHCSAT